MSTSAKTTRAKTQSGGAASGKARHRIGTILVSTDFSAESLKAIDYAVSLLGAYEGTLHLVHVCEIDYSYAAPAAMLAVPPTVMDDDMERHQATELKELAARYSINGVQPECHVRTGRAFDEICRLAAQLPADLIVIATRGHTGLKHLLLGSTAERVVRHSPCPVLIVREREREFADTGAADTATSKHTLPIRRILVPVDFSECSRAGVDYALNLASTCDASILLLHAVQVLPYIPSERYAAHERAPAPGVLERAARSQMKKFVREIDFRGVRHEAEVRAGRPAEEICRYSDQKNADLIVTSTHGITGFAHVLIGSTAEHVVRYAYCPVLVVPRRDRETAQKGS